MAKWLGMPFAEEYEGLNLKSLPLNRAYVLVNTTIDNVGVYSVDKNCFKCPYKLVKKLTSNEEYSWQVDTSVEKTWKVLNSGDWQYVANHYRSGLLCQETTAAGEFGVYQLNVGLCNFETKVESINSFLPLQLFGLILLACFMVYIATKSIIKCRKSKSFEEVNLNVGKPEDKLRSLHYFRGLLTIVIILTTSEAGGYPIFYKKFGGISIPDIAFYALAWTIGVHIPQAIDDAVTSGRKIWRIVGNIVLRSFILILSGITMDALGVLSISSDKLWSPLSRIGLAYCLAASVYAVTSLRTDKTFKKFICKIASTIYTLLWSWLLFGLILAALVISMSIFANFNCFGDPDAMVFKANYSNSESEVAVTCENNNYTDFQTNVVFLADKSLIVDVKSYVGYSGGLLGTLSTILYTMIGLKTGVILAHYDSLSDRFKLWTFWAVFFGAIGSILAAIPLPDFFNLWPIATIFIISSVSTYILMFISWKTRYQVQKKISPVLSMGYSFLPIMFGHLLFSKCIPFSFDLGWNCHFWNLLDNVWTLALWIVIGSVLMRKNVRLTV